MHIIEVSSKTRYLSFEAVKFILANVGNKIAQIKAIKAIRGLTNMGLREAKELVDELLGQKLVDVTEK